MSHVCSYLMFTSSTVIINTAPSYGTAKITAGNGQVLTINAAQIEPATFLMPGMTVYGSVPELYGGKNIKMVILSLEPRANKPLPRPKSGPGSRGPSKKYPDRYPDRPYKCMSGDGCTHLITSVNLSVLKREYEHDGAKVDECPFVETAKCGEMLAMLTSGAVGAAAAGGDAKAVGASASVVPSTAAAASAAAAPRRSRSRSPGATKKGSHVRRTSRSRSRSPVSSA